MSCQEIIAILLTYQAQVAEIFPGNDFTFEISSQYSFITVNVSRSGQRYAHLTFEIGNDSAKLNDVYCEDRTSEEETRKKITAIAWPGLRSKEEKALPYSEDIIKQLNLADNIAALAVNCTAGDNYRPGNFSEILLSEENIELSQVNHMNAKSLAHKKDYSLRSLVFTIPLSGTAALTRADYQVGSMTVEFSDRSSENNKRCGQEIEDELTRLSN
jgi:hypothetical protein